MTGCDSHCELKVILSVIKLIYGEIVSVTNTKTNISFRSGLIQVYDWGFGDFSWQTAHLSFSVRDSHGSVRSWSLQRLGD